MMRVFEILQYFKVQCNYVKKITEGLFIEYSMYESPMTMSKILYPLARVPLNFEALGFSPPSL
jgi:hypothetical protein